MSRWAATSTTCWRGVDDAQRVEIEHGVAERHRHLVLGLKLDRSGQLLAIGHRRQLERAHDGALVGDPYAHALGQPLVAEQLAQYTAQIALIDHLALADGVGGERQHGGALGDYRAVDACLHGPDEARLNVEPHDGRPRAMTETELERGARQLQRRIGQFVGEV
jgi:hypothetical protein